MLSIVIPALNEERALPATLAALSAQVGEFEVLVVDGGSGDRTVEIVQQCDMPNLTLLRSAAGRAAQMNQGAAAATGDMLLFLHADTLLPTGAVTKLNQLAASGHAQFGGFHQRFSGDALGLRAVSWIHNFRCRLTDVFYGDQAMFVRRELFAEVGGFPMVDELEDVLLSEALSECAKPAFLEACVTTDSRKFEQMGVLSAFFYCVLILCCYELRLPILGRRFFAAYR